MACSTISKMVSRPSLVLLGLVLLAMAGSISGNPIPDSENIGTNIKESLNSAASSTKGFIDRATNTFTGKDVKEDEKLTPIELAAIIAAAVILLLILPCCIGYCLCECVKELICCICCCGCCRD